MVIPAGKKWVAYIPAGAFVQGKGHRVSLVVEGDTGHHPTGDPKNGKAPWYWGNPDNERTSYSEAVATAATYNARRGIDADEAQRIVDESIAASIRERE